MAELTVAQKDVEITRLQSELVKKEAELKKKEEEDEEENNSGSGAGSAGTLGPLPPNPQPVPIYYPVPYYVDPNSPQEQVVPASNPVDDHYAAVLGDKNTQPEDNPTCEKIPTACAEILQDYFWKINSGKDISAALKECECPEHCESLKPMDINEEVKSSMKTDDNTKNSTMCYICTALAKAAQPLASA